MTDAELFLAQPLAPNCMLGPFDKYPRGSEEWAEALAGNLRIDYQKATMTKECKWLIQDLDVALSERPYPWDVWPTVVAPDPRRWLELLLREPGWDTQLLTILELHSESLYPKVRELLDLAAPLPVQGEIGNGRRADNISSTSHGTSESYIRRRLARDRPDLLKALTDGEIKSARQAGIAAGFVKDVPSVRLTSPEAVAAAIRKRWSPEQVQALCAALR